MEYLHFSLVELLGPSHWCRYRVVLNKFSSLFFKIRLLQNFKRQHTVDGRGEFRENINENNVRVIMILIINNNTILFF